MSFKEEDYRGVPCILVYSESGSPVPQDNAEGVTGGRAPHHAASSGYVYAENGKGNKFDRYAHVFNMEWKPLYEPTHWIVYARQKRGKDDWQEVGKFPMTSNMAEFAAIGMAYVYKRDYSLHTRIVGEERDVDATAPEQTA